MATFRDFDYPDLPEALLLDTDFVIRAMRHGQPYHRCCARFARRLQQKPQPVIIYSSLLEIEFWQAALHIELKTLLGRGWHAELQRNPTVIRRVHPRIEAAWQAASELLDRSDDRLLVEMTPAIRQDALRFMGCCALQSADAIHLATASFLGVQDITTFDRHFDHAPHLVIRRRR